MAYSQNIKMGLPSMKSGIDGDLELRIVQDGVALFGKVRNNWYKFGHGDLIGALGKADRSRRGGHLLGNTLSLYGSMRIRDATFNISKKRNLDISTNTWNIKTDDSDDTCSFEIGDILFAAGLGTNTIGIETGSNNSSNHLKIYGGSSTASNNPGGHVFIHPGGGNGAGSDGRTIIGHTGGGTASGFIHGVALDIWSTTYLRATKKLYFDGAQTTAGLLDTSAHTYIVESGDDILDFYVGAVNMLKLDEANDKIKFTGGAIQLLDTTNVNDYFQISVTTEGATTLSTVDADTAVGHLTLAPDGDLIITTDHNTGQVTIDKNSTNTATATNTAMQIDLDHTGISASGQTITNVALDLDMNCESVTHVGTVNQIGLDIDMVAVDDGTQTNTGIDINVSGGNNNYGMNITTADEDGDYHIKLMHGGDVNDYATFHVQNTGDLTIATVGDGSLDSDLILDVDGDIELNADGGNVNIKDGATTHFQFDCDNTRIRIHDDDNGLDYFTITIAAEGATTIATEDADTTAGHLILDIDGSLILDPADGKYIAKNNGTEFSATDSAYAGMILGYTRLEGDLTNQGSFEIQNALTVEDQTHQITFKTPPSEIVEIEATFFINFTTTSTNLNVGLSDNSTYNAVAAQFEYDAHGHPFSDGEADDGVYTIKWILSASHLASVGSSNTFYVGFSTAGSTKTAYLMYGVRASHGICDHPFVIKATALPAAIYDGL